MSKQPKSISCSWGCQLWQEGSGNRGLLYSEKSRGAPWKLLWRNSFNSSNSLLALSEVITSTCLAGLPCPAHPSCLVWVLASPFPHSNRNGSRQSTAVHGIITVKHFSFWCTHGNHLLKMIYECFVSNENNVLNVSIIFIFKLTRKHLKMQRFVI